MLQITPAKVAFDPAAQIVARQERLERQERLKSSAAVPAAVRRASSPAAPRPRRAFKKFSPGSRDANSRDGKPTGPKRRQP